MKVSAAAFRGVDAGRRLMEALGYAPERTFWVMRGEVASLPVADALTGIEIRRYRPGVDDVEIHGALSEAFDDHWGWPFAPYDEWREAAIEGEGSGYDPGFWFVATENGAIVGASIAIASSPRNEHAAYVQDLGVRRVSRRRGIATALLAATFAEARSRGITEVELAVDSESETGAPALYERAGMRVVYAWEEWTKAIPAGD
ncbi:MAG TPA: GNAT family N-acetyltransferase [Actinomycetota bacterium]|nr:GNAT family N-acetyltransferase [Actinomycetota bacterium]